MPLCLPSSCSVRGAPVHGSRGRHCTFFYKKPWRQGSGTGRTTHWGQWQLEEGGLQHYHLCCADHSSQEQPPAGVQGSLRTPPPQLWARPLRDASWHHILYQASVAPGTRMTSMPTGQPMWRLSDQPCLVYTVSVQGKLCTS